MSQYRCDICGMGLIARCLCAVIYYSHQGLTITWDMGHRRQVGVMDDFGDWVPVDFDQVRHYGGNSGGLAL